MPTYVLLTKLAPDATRDPKSYRELVDRVRERLRKDCPEVKWLANYWLLGPYDYLDIYDAPNEEVATKVSAIIRTFGQSTPETWTAVPFDRFLELVDELGVAGRRRGRRAAPRPTGAETRRRARGRSR